MPVTATDPVCSFCCGGILPSPPLLHPLALTVLCNVLLAAERRRGRGRGKQWRDRSPSPPDAGAAAVPSENQVITDYGIEEWRDSGKIYVIPLI